jgi:D-alanyl-D-alanine carboxypeptidase (penicillin-binding protein 5/6)
LVCEALADGKFSKDDMVAVSEYASSMGGSQVFLKEGERISVEELIKCTVIASANDAAVALAELVAGSEEAFVSKMNARAMELQLQSTHFENVTGLDDTTVNHVTSALDIAIMSRELINHEIILKYSSVWQDSIRDGEFVLTNTNRLVRFYDGCNGLKTGSTDKAGFCMSATAKRGGMQLIAVVMGAETRDSRNNIARKLLDYGFANYSLYSVLEEEIKNIPVLKGTENNVMLYTAPFSDVVNKSDYGKIERIYKIPENVSAPVSEGQSLGTVEYMLNGEKIGESAIYAKENIDKINFMELYGRLLRKIFGENRK